MQFNTYKKIEIEYKVYFSLVSSYSNTGSIRDDPFWTSRKNSLELIELSNINKLKLIQILSSLPDNLHLHVSLRTAFLRFAFYP